MKHIFYFILILLCNAACHHGEHAHGAPAESEAATRDAHPLNVVVQDVAAGTFTQVIKTGGQLLSAQNDEVTVAATSSGIVSFSGATGAEGATVTAGQTLCTVSAKHIADGDPAVKTAAAYNAALKEYERAKELVKDRIISEREFEQAQLQYETAKAAYHAHAGNNTSGGIKITSPLSGTVKQRWACTGEYVTVGQPLLRLAKNKRLQLKADVPAKYFNTLRHVADAHFKTPSDEHLYTLRELNGRRLSVGAALNPSSGYVPVTFEFDNNGALLAGAYAEVYLLADTQHDVVSIPLTAVTEEQGLYFVYLQHDDGDYEKQEVALGSNDGVRVHILSGLAPGDRIVTQGVTQVRLAVNRSVIPDTHQH
ncbi:MAG: efflux RND transporter periplasmic adaptor subunit [Prevotellaceae bacterium]|jgi:RND family efflux transporter MFP subunit|nr:efflux RND transporter periplasmic adaptor subunit [Prevotellaceae bacterium]